MRSWAVSWASSSGWSAVAMRRTRSRTLAGDGRVEQRFAAADGLERRDQVARPDLLEQVPAGTGDDGRQDRLLIGVAGQHHDPRLGHLGSDLAAGLDRPSRPAAARP